MEVIRDALSLAAAVVVTYPEELAGQMVGRLLDANGPAAVSLVEQARAWRNQPWLCPMTPSLMAAGGQLEQILAAGDNKLLAISDDGLTAVFADFDGVVRLWDLASGRERWSHETGLSLARLAVQPDGSRVAAADDSGSGTIWDATTGRVEARTDLHGIPVDLSLSPQGPCAVVLRDEQAWLTCAHRAEDIALGDQGADAAALLRGCRRVLTAVGEDVWIFDPEKGSATGPLLGHGDTIEAIAVTPDGARAVTASRDKTLIVWDVEAGSFQATLIGHASFVLDASAGTDEHRQRVVSTSADRSIRAWDLETAEPLGILEGPVAFPRAVMSADARMAVSTTVQGGHLRVWDLERWEASTEPEAAGDLVLLVAVTPDCTRAVAVYHVLSIRRWDLEHYQRSGAPIGTSDIFGVRAVTITPDGRHAVLGGTDGDIEVWDLDDRIPMCRFTAPHGDVSSLAVTANGRLIVSAGENALAIHDLETGDLARHVRIDGIQHVHPTADDDRVMLEVGGSLCSLELGHQGEQPVMRRFAALDDCSPTRDGRYALGRSDGTLLVAELFGEERRRPLQHSSRGRFHTCTVRPDSGRVVATEVGSVDVWDLESGAHLSTRRFHADLRPWVSWAVSDDGTTVVAVDNGGTSHFLRV